MQEAKLDHDAMLTAVREDDVKKQLIDETAKAVNRGVFGAPTMIVDDELHFGQDRLHWVEQKLAAAAST